MNLNIISYLLLLLFNERIFSVRKYFEHIFNSSLRTISYGTCLHLSKRMNTDSYISYRIRAYSQILRLPKVRRFCCLLIGRNVHTWSLFLASLASVYSRLKDDNDYEMLPFDYLFVYIFSDMRQCFVVSEWEIVIALSFISLQVFTPLKFEES
jgi:hypothetical protein